MVALEFHPSLSEDFKVSEAVNVSQLTKLADEILSKWNGLDNVYDAIDLMSSSALSSAIRSARGKLFGPLQWR